MEKKMGSKDGINLLQERREYYNYEQGTEVRDERWRETMGSQCGGI